jgi:hypothetical protein
MAVRLLKEWVAPADESNPTFTHTAIDDLESFVWVLLWVLLERYRRRNGVFPHTCRDWWTDLNSRDVRVQSKKWDLLSDIKESLDDQEELGPIMPFAQLISEWGELAQEGRKAVRRQAPTLDFFKVFYEKYLKAGFLTLDKLPVTGGGWGK